MDLARVKRTLLHWILPETCEHCREDLSLGESLLCRGCFVQLRHIEHPFCLRCAARASPRSLFCPVCANKAFCCRLIRSAFRYDGPAVSLVHAFKYRGRRKAARLAGLLMARALSRFPELGGVGGLVPMPLHPRRESARGYNQARLLADAISASSGLPMLELLTREKNTAPQWNLDRGARRQNVRGAFLADSSARGKSLLLIDDVCTTAASLEEAAKELLRAGARGVRGYVFTRQAL